MNNKLKNLAKIISYIDLYYGNQILVLAGRYDKTNKKLPTLQPAYYYIMYLKLMRGINESTFHHMKRKYLDTTQDIQKECQKELDKMILEDATKLKIPSSEIRLTFQDKLKKFNLTNNFS